MKTTLAQFEASCVDQIRKKVKQVRSPHPASRLAMVNHEDNFVHYFKAQAFDIIIEEFMLLDDMKDASDELYNWFNNLSTNAYTIPLISQTLRAIWQEYNAR